MKNNNPVSWIKRLANSKYLRLAAVGTAFLGASLTKARAADTTIMMATMIVTDTFDDNNGNTVGISIVQWWDPTTGVHSDVRLQVVSSTAPSPQNSAQTPGALNFVSAMDVGSVNNVPLVQWIYSGISLQRNPMTIVLTVALGTDGNAYYFSGTDSFVNSGLGWPDNSWITANYDDVTHEPSSNLGNIGQPTVNFGWPMP